MKIEIWSEGYNTTGIKSDAIFLFETEADSFDEAIAIYAKHRLETESDAERFPIEKRGGPDDWHWSIWGCQLFDNEADARKRFG